MQVTLQWPLLLAPLDHMVTLAAAKTILGGRRFLPSSGCSGSGGFCLLGYGGSGGGGQSLLRIGIFWFLFSLSLLFRGQVD